MVRDLFKTKQRRFFAVLLFVCCSVAVGIGMSWWTHDAVKPGALYYYTIKSDDIDIQSPTGKRIIDYDAYPRASSANHKSMSQTLKDRCAFRESVQEGDAPYSEYREVYFCNTAGAVGEDLYRRYNYFKRVVDAEYWTYYGQVVRHFSKLLCLGLLAWGAMVTAWVVGRWVSRGA